MMLYNLENPMHQALVQKFEIGPAQQELTSIKMAYFGETAYLYVNAKDTLMVIKCSPYYSVYIPDDQVEAFSLFTNLTFTVRPGNKQFGAYQNININLRKTGYVLEAFTDEIKFQASRDDGWVDVNLDQYFTGYRNRIDIKYPQEDDDLKQYSPLDEPGLIIQYPNVTLIGKYEFASIQESNQKQKALIYLGEEQYVYVDCNNLVYLQIKNDFVEVVYRQPHNIPNKITKATYWPNLKFNKVTYPYSLGTVVVQYSMNGNEELIQF